VANRIITKTKIGHCLPTDFIVKILSLQIAIRLDKDKNNFFKLPGKRLKNALLHPLVSTQVGAIVVKSADVVQINRKRDGNIV